MNNLKALSLIIGLLVVLSGCSFQASKRRPMSIGHEDLTHQKAVNVVVSFSDNSATLSAGADSIIAELNRLAAANKLMLNSATKHLGDGLDVADLHFNESDYNWLIQVVDRAQPEVRYQNFSNDIDISDEVHFRYCQERKIELANIPPDVLAGDYKYWQSELYRAAVQAIYLLMKGNTHLEPVQVQNYLGRAVNGFKFGESDKYGFVLKGETHIYLVPKKEFSSWH